MEHNTNALQEVLIMLAAAVAIVAIFRQFRLSPVLGFLVAGAAIGPTGLGLIGGVEQKSYLAEFGVVFLLFMIGLELSFTRLREMRKYVLGLGSLQVLVTSLIIGYCCYLFLDNWKAAIIVGLSFAMSSTAVVLQVLSDTGERLNQVGRVSFSILLLQDLAVIPLLILLPMMANNSTNLFSEMGTSFLYALVIIGTLIVAGKVLLTPILTLIAKASKKSSELFVATTLLLALGSAYATQHFGLSLALGAFIAGLLIAETEFRKQVEIDINPFKNLLMGLFFMTVGMSFDLNELIRRLPEVVIFSILLISVKAVVILSICRVFNLGWENSIRSSIMLAQGSEFAFVLFGLALEKKLLTQDLGQLLLLVVSFTMAFTPLLYEMVNFIFRKQNQAKKSDLSKITETEDLEGHFIICGFGWVGENLAKLFTEERIKFVAIDQETKRVKIGRALGLPVYYGDASRAEILRSLQIKNAKAVIITIHDSRPVKKILHTLKSSYKDITVIARVKHVDEMEELKKAGATIVIPEAYESAMNIAKNALGINGISESEASRAINSFMTQQIEEKE